MSRMVQRGVSSYGDTLNYTLGLILDQHLGIDRIQHGGSTGDYRAFLAYYPGLDAAVVVLANTGDVSVTRVAEQTAAAFFGHDLAPRSVTPDEPMRGVEVKSQVLDGYVGSYWEPGEGVISFGRIGQTLVVTQPQDDAGPLVALDDSTFQLEDGITLRFFPTSDAVIIHEIGRGGTRLTRVASVPQRINYSDYSGRYFSEEIETFYAVAVEGDNVTIVHRRLGEVPLRPLGYDIFEGRWPLGEVVFEQDENDEVVGFSVTEGRTIGVQFRRTH